jgi:hypothetical protein
LEAHVCLSEGGVTQAQAKLLTASDGDGGGG